MLFEQFMGIGPKSCSKWKKRLAHKGCSWRNSAEPEKHLPHFAAIILPILDLISLNKYVVTLIAVQANSCLTYNSVGVILFFDFPLPLPFIEKILLLLMLDSAAHPRYNCAPNRDSIRELFFQKFVLSSIIRCLKI